MCRLLGPLCSLVLSLNTSLLFSQVIESRVLVRTGQAFENQTIQSFGRISATENGLFFTAKLAGTGGALLLYADDRSALTNRLADAALEPGPFSEFQALDSSSGGWVAFVARDRIGNDALYLTRESSPGRICVEGEALDGITVADIQEVAVNRTGEVAFTAWTSGGRGPFTLFIARDGEVKALASSGDRIGTETLGLPGRLELSDSGEVLFVNGRKVGPLSMQTLPSLIGVSASQVRRWAAPGMIPLQDGWHFEEHQTGRGIQAYSPGSAADLWFVADVGKRQQGVSVSRQRLFRSTPQGIFPIGEFWPAGDRIRKLQWSADGLYLLVGKQFADHSVERALHRLTDDGRHFQIISEGDPSPSGQVIRRIRDFAVREKYLYLSAVVEGGQGVEFMILGLRIDDLPMD